MCWKITGEGSVVARQITLLRTLLKEVFLSSHNRSGEGRLLSQTYHYEASIRDISLQKGVVGFLFIKLAVAEIKLSGDHRSSHLLSCIRTLQAIKAVSAEREKFSHHVLFPRLSRAGSASWSHRVLRFCRVSELCVCWCWRSSGMDKTRESLQTTGIRGLC